MVSPYFQSSLFVTYGRMARAVLFFGIMTNAVETTAGSVGTSKRRMLEIAFELICLWGSRQAGWVV